MTEEGLYHVAASQASSLPLFQVRKPRLARQRAWPWWHSWQAAELVWTPGLFPDLGKNTAAEQPSALDLDFNPRECLL